MKNANKIEHYMTKKKYAKLNFIKPICTKEVFCAFKKLTRRKKDQSTKAGH